MPFTFNLLAQFVAPCRVPFHLSIDLMAVPALLCGAAMASNALHATDERVFVPPARTGGDIAAILNWKGNIMNAIKFIIAAGFAIATTGAFAETTVTTSQTEHVANIYGRASAPQSGNVADSGRDSSKEDTKVAVRAGNKQVGEFGRS